MPSPASRVLACLELLQDRPAVTGAELAAHLEVHPRTVRRYVVALQELGVPVDAARGPGGGYRLRPGFRMPPLMLDDDEAAVVVLGLLAARRLGLDAPRPTVDRALAKVGRVLPAALRTRTEALAQVVAFAQPAAHGVPAPSAVLLALADAIGRRRAVRCAYTTHAGDRAERELSPYGLVAHLGRWYLAAHDHGRGALRTFRVDRVERLAPAGAARPSPAGFDALAHVQHALAEAPWSWAVEVALALPHARAAERVPPTLATLEPLGPDRTLLRMRVESLAFAAALLAGLDCAFTVRAPGELRDAVRALATRLAASAGA